MITTTKLVVYVDSDNGITHHQVQLLPWYPCLCLKWRFLVSLPVNVASVIMMALLSPLIICMSQVVALKYVGTCAVDLPVLVRDFTDYDDLQQDDASELLAAAPAVTVMRASGPFVSGLPAELFVLRYAVIYSRRRQQQLERQLQQQTAVAQS